MIKAYEASAAALYDGGWKAKDRDQRIEEYKLSEKEEEKNCEILEKYENEKQ